MDTSAPHRPRVFRDPIHGDITFPRGPFQRLLESVIDTEMFQRLRGIRQTAVMNLVFHGAEHSRFTHSMGAAYVAGQMFDWAAGNSGLVLSQAEREDTVLAALLHDVGHGPFSHSLEEIIGPSFVHERVSVRILTAPESPIQRLLSAHDPGLPERLHAFIEPGAVPRRWYHAIVSSQLDADRLDYLVRDAAMAGIRTHQLDLGRLIRSLAVVQDRLAVDARAHDLVEAFLLALDQMYGTAYYHKTVRAASLLLEAMVRRAFDLAGGAGGALAGGAGGALASGAAGAPLRERLFPSRGGRLDPFYLLLAHGDAVPLEDYVRLDEAHVAWLFALWRDAPDPTLAELCAAYRTRRFPKMVRLPVETAALTSAEWQEAVAAATEIFRRRFPDRDPAYGVHFDQPERLSYKRYASGAGGAAAAAGAAEPIRLTTAGGGARPIESDPRSIANNLSTRIYFPRLYVPEEIRADVEAALGRRPPFGA